MKPDAISRESGRTKAAKGLLMSYGSMAALVLIILVFSLVAPNFLSLSNLTLMLGQVSVVGVIAFGATFVLILGGLDLSIMGIPGFVGSLVAMLLSRGMGTFPAILIGCSRAPHWGWSTACSLLSCASALFTAALRWHGSHAGWTCG